jgi:hypothetical protein
MRSPQHTPPTPRQRAFIAANVTEARAANGSLATSATLDHIASITTRIPKGTRGRPVLGGDVLRALVPGLELAIRRRLGIREGTALELLTMLWLAGLIVLPGPPNRKSAGPAMARLAELTPLVQVIVRGRYRLYAGDPAFHPEWLADAVLLANARDASASKAAADAQQIDASAFGAPEISTLVLGSDLLKERARGGTSQDPSSASDGEEHGLASGRPGAVSGSSSAPAERAGARPATPPARAPLEPLALTRSAWMALVPLRVQQQRAAALGLRYLEGAGMRGTVAAVAARLAQAEGGATSRSRASLTRAMLGQVRMGLLLEIDGWIRLPVFADEPVLEMLDIPAIPDPRRPSVDLTAWLGEQGVDARALSHAEAVMVSRRLWTRLQENKPSVGKLLRIERAERRAGLPTDLRRLGRLDHGAARHALAGAMAARMSGEARWRDHA